MNEPGATMAKALAHLDRKPGGDILDILCALKARLDHLDAVLARLREVAESENAMLAQLHERVTELESRRK